MKTVEEIQNTIHESRRRIGFHYVALSEEIDITMRLRNSIRRRPWSWMSGALATGIIASFLNRGHSSKSVSYQEESDTVKKRSSFRKHLAPLLLGETTLALAAIKFLRFLLPWLRPIITEYVTRQFHRCEKEYRTFDSSP